MDRLERYRSLIKEAILESPYYLYGSSEPDEETLFLCDEKKDYFMLYDIGWRGTEPISTIRLLVRIKNNKIWIDEDWTEDGITGTLLKAGVPKEDIVLAFHHPNRRQYTDFAVA